MLRRRREHGYRDLGCHDYRASRQQHAVARRCLGRVGLGVLTGNQTVLQRVNVAGFYANICIGQTAEDWSDVQAASGWYNLYFVNTGMQGGQYLNNMQLTPRRSGAIGIAPSGANMSSMRAIGVGTGQAPYWHLH